MLIGWLAGMLAIAAALVVLSSTLTGIGLAIRRAFALPTLSLDDCFVAFWVGYASTLCFLILWNFALPVGLTALLAVLIAGAIGLWLTRRQLTRLVRERSWKPRWWEVLFLTAGVAWVVNHAVAGFASWDGVLYHVQAVKWAKAYPVVPGIANLHGPLAFNNGSFLYDAMVDSGWWEGRGFHIANALLLFVAVLQGSVNGLYWLHGDRQSLRRCFGFVLLALAFHFSYDVASYSTDLPVALVFGAAAILIVRLIDARGDHTRDREDAYNVFALAVILAGAVAIKLTAGIFAALALPVAMLIRFGRRPTRAPGLRTAVIAAGLALSVFSVAWLARGVIMSGYPFFPIAIGGLPVEWRAPVEHAQAEAAYIAFTEREFNWSLVSRDWVRLLAFRDVNAVAVPGIVGAMAFLIWWRSRKASHPPVDEAVGFSLVMLIPVVAWFLTAPSHRYIPGLFWSLAAFWVAQSQRVTWPTLSDRRRQWSTAAVVAIALSPLVIEPGFVQARRGRNPWPAIQQYNFVAPGPDTALAEIGGRVDVVVFETQSGLALNTPMKTAFRGLPNGCWNAPLPCTPNPAPNLALRVPGDLARGFKVDGDWSMVDWPYYHQTGFLSEWRRRRSTSK